MATKIIGNLTLTGSAYISGNIDLISIPVGFSTHTSSFTTDNDNGGITISSVAPGNVVCDLSITPGTFNCLVKGGGFTIADSNSQGMNMTEGSLSLTSPSMSFFPDVTPVVRPLPIPDATGGATVDTQARSAINSLLQAMRDLGLIGLP